MITSNCKQCDKVIIRRGGKAPVFCSLVCKGEWQKSQKIFNKEWLYQKYIVEELSTYQIADLVNRNPKQVYQWLKGYSIPTRPRGQNLKEKDCYMRKPDVVNPFLGKHHSEKTRQRMSEEATKPRPHLRGEKNGMYGFTGAKNKNWKGGFTPERQAFYSSIEWGNAVKIIWKRDKGICQKCKIKRSANTTFHIHHIVSFQVKELRAEPTNLVLLCQPCHRWVHSRANVNKEFRKEV